MAGAAAKKRAKAAAEKLRFLAIIAATTHILFFVLRVGLNSASFGGSGHWLGMGTIATIYAASGWASLRQARHGLSTEAPDDVFYVTAIVHISWIFTDAAWWLFAVVPVYALWAFWGQISGLCSICCSCCGSGGSGMEGEEEQEVDANVPRNRRERRRFERMQRREK